MAPLAPKSPENNGSHPRRRDVAAQTASDGLREDAKEGEGQRNVPPPPLTRPHAPPGRQEDNSDRRKSKHGYCPQTAATAQAGGRKGRPYGVRCTDDALGGKQKNQQHKPEARILSPGSGHRPAKGRDVEDAVPYGTPPNTERRRIRGAAKYEAPHERYAVTAFVKSPKRGHTETNVAPLLRLRQSALKVMVRGYVGAAWRRKRQAME